MKWRVVAGFAVGLLAIALFVVLVGWEEVLAAIGQTDQTVFVWAFGCTLVALFFRSLVWIHLLGILDHDIGKPTVAGMFLSAKFFKYISPYGQVSATPGIAWFVGAFTDVDYERNLAAVVSADLFTYSPYYTFGGIALVITLLGAAPLPNVELYLAASAVIVVLLAAVLWTALFNRQLTERAVIGVLSPLGWVFAKLGSSLGDEFTAETLSDRIAGFYETIDSLLDDRPTLVAGVVFGHVAWFFLMLPLIVVASAMGVELALVSAMLIIALSKLGFVVPLPGGIAGVEFTIAGLLVIIAGVSTSDAVAMAILYRFATFWFTVLLGGLSASAIIIRWPGRQSILGR